MCVFFFTLLHSCQEFEHPLILIITFIIKFSVLGCAYTLEKSPKAFTDVHDDGVRGLVLLVAKDLIDDDGKDAFTVDDEDANDSLGGGSGNSVSSTVSSVQDGFHSCSSLLDAHEMFFVNIRLILLLTAVFKFMIWSEITKCKYTQIPN